ncbi:uncharacterized protein LOC143150090 isoform X2 [Ptiloglossa arizonensis]|uniref:uncharacterized protein LOC143150090 isoform X2 n=1 Tax=Ptiloglossa arizonensis TaxID=3350558 RepID=UPI003FA0F5E8
MYITKLFHILKASKPQQSLNFDDSLSTDISPATTTKIKRRVSFAEKKHVKKFCNSVEQGTVWDNTYEEHDLSNLKIPCPNNEKNCDIHDDLICINSETVEKCSMQENSVQLASNKVIHEDLNVENCTMNFTDTVEKLLPNASSVILPSTVKQKNGSIFATNLQLCSDNHTHKSITVYEESNKNTPNKISNSQKSNINNVSYNNMNTTSVKDTHMNLTNIVCNLVHVDTDCIQDNELRNTHENISLELTEVVPASMNICRNVIQNENHLHKQNIEKYNTTMEKKIDQSISMESNIAILPVLKPTDNVSMEITAAVSTMLKENCCSNSVTSDNDKGITIFNDESMEITNAVKINTYVNMSCGDKVSDGLSIIKVSQCKCNIYDDEKTMEMIETEPVNMQCDTNLYETSENLNKITTYTNEEMECTAALTSIHEVYPNNLKNNKSDQNTSYIYQNSHNSILNSCKNDAMVNSISDRTKIFHNTSMVTTAVVSSLNMKGTCEKEIECESNFNNQELGKALLFPNIPVEITQAMPVLQSDFQVNSSIVNAIEVEQLVSSEKFENNLPHDSLNQTTVLNDTILKNISTSMIPSSLESHICLDKKDSRNLEDSLTNESRLNKVQNSVNNRISMTMHNSIKENTCVLAVKETNMETACPTINSESINFVASKINQRKMSTTQLCTDHSFTSNSRENIKLSEMNNDVQEKNDFNDQEKCSLMEQSFILCNGNWEELESIKPPSFICLDESTSVNSTCDQNINTNTYCFSESVNRSKVNEYENISTVKCHYQNCNSVQNNQVNEVEVNANNEPDSLRLETNDQAQINESAMNTKPKESLKPHDSSVENEISIELNHFSSLIKELRVYAKSDEIIWDVYHENIEREMFIIGFISCSLLVVVFLKDDTNVTSVQLIKDIKIISRLADDADVLISIVHKIILEKLDAQELMNLYKNNKDILPMLDYVSKEVKLVMDFMFDLKHLDNLNLMDISHNSISFVSFTKRMEIILKITVNIKPFEKIESQDISVQCLLGSVREEDIIKLLSNIKRDNRFLRRYMSDVRDYIYVIEQSSTLIDLL